MNTLTMTTIPGDFGDGNIPTKPPVQAVLPGFNFPGPGKIENISLNKTNVENPKKTVLETCRDTSSEVTRILDESTGITGGAFNNGEDEIIGYLNGRAMYGNKESQPSRGH